MNMSKSEFEIFVIERATAIRQDMLNIERMYQRGEMDALKLRENISDIEDELFMLQDMAREYNALAD